MWKKYFTLPSVLTPMTAYCAPWSLVIKSIDNTKCLNHLLVHKSKLSPAALAVWQFIEGSLYFIWCLTLNASQPKHFIACILFNAPASVHWIICLPCYSSNSIHLTLCISLYSSHYIYIYLIIFISFPASYSMHVIKFI